MYAKSGFCQLQPLDVSTCVRQASVSPSVKPGAGQMSQFPPKTLNFNGAYRDDMELFARLMSHEHGGLP